MGSKEKERDVPRNQEKPLRSNGAALPAGQVEGDISSGLGNSANWAPAHGRRVSLEEYWEKWYGRPHAHIDVSYEWNNGILEAKPLPTYQQTKQYRWFFGLLSFYLEVNPIATILCLETGAHMAVPDEKMPSGQWEVVFKPDIGIIRDDNPAAWRDTEQHSYAGVCDMIVEELSDSTTAEVRRDTEEKREGYARAGVREYFILDAKDRNMHFYRLGAAGNYDEIGPDAEGVIGSQVLPGFQFRREDLLRQPAHAEMARDAVYAGYVMPDLQVAEIKAEKAEERADTEAQRADAEARRADTEAQRADTAEEALEALRAELARLRRQGS